MTADRNQVLAPGQVADEWCMSDSEFAALGDGELAYIKPLTSEEALAAYPSIEDLPQGLSLYALHAADGTPIALTDDMGTAIEHAMGDELEIASLH
ncbi:MAG TPA: DUF1150 domain-containing protein [Hyphomicrobiaceae bacterium]|nr:DUF1150 domain-containing protein [Hyphomicrobiaceae bacterium]